MKSDVYHWNYYFYCFYSRTGCEVLVADEFQYYVDIFESQDCFQVKEISGRVHRASFSFREKPRAENDMKAFVSLGFIWVFGEA